MFFNTHFPRISAVQLQQPRLHWVVRGCIVPHSSPCEAGEGPDCRAHYPKYITSPPGPISAILESNHTILIKLCTHT